MMQASLFDHDHLAQVVNVASVPQRSPFRYPGGKTWLVPRVREWLSPMHRMRLGITPHHPQEFIEPFAGGGIISLTVAAERLAEHVTMVELDTQVAAVWQTMLDPCGNEWLAHQILDFHLTHEAVESLLGYSATSTWERAFQTIVKNRIYHGGILAPGSGRLKHGENGRGIHSRWYPETLAKRIRSIAQYGDRITFIEGDGLNVMQTHATDPNVVFFLDPPYSIEGQGKRAGKRLYTHFYLDHPQVFSLAERFMGDFLMTYDNALEVAQLAHQHQFDTREISMKTTHHAKLTELLIGRNLAWIEQRGVAQ